MAKLFAIFRAQNRFQELIKPHHITNHALLSSTLIQEITSHQREFASFISSQHDSIQKIEKLTLVHLLILHAPQLSGLIDSIVLNLQTDDQWINHHVLVPYQNFIRKLILSAEQYQRVRAINKAWNRIVSEFGQFEQQEQMRKDSKVYFNFQVLCFCINMLNELLGFLKKVPTLGRYYPKHIYSSFDAFVKVASYQTALFYFSFKFIVTEFLAHHDALLPTPDQKKFLRDILQRDLQPINQGMKEIFLNKYYNPIENGIKVGLLQLDHLPDNSKKGLQELNIFQPKNSKKSKKNSQYLRQKIFAKKDFDSQMFEQSLNWIGSRQYQEEDLQEIYEKQNVNILNRQNQQRCLKKRVIAQVLSDLSVH